MYWSERVLWRHNALPVMSKIVMRDLLCSCVRRKQREETQDTYEKRRYDNSRVAWRCNSVMIFVSHWLRDIAWSSRYKLRNIELISCRFIRGAARVVVFYRRSRCEEPASSTGDLNRQKPHRRLRICQIFDRYTKPAMICRHACGVAATKNLHARGR